MFNVTDYSTAWTISQHVKRDAAIKQIMFERDHVVNNPSVSLLYPPKNEVLGVGILVSLSPSVRPSVDKIVSSP